MVFNTCVDLDATSSSTLGTALSSAPVHSSIPVHPLSPMVYCGVSGWRADVDLGRLSGLILFSATVYTSLCGCMHI